MSANSRWDLIRGLKLNTQNERASEHGHKLQAFTNRKTLREVVNISLPLNRDFAS
jgi:hypothetical protein